MAHPQHRARSPNELPGSGPGVRRRSRPVIRPAGARRRRRWRCCDCPRPRRRALPSRRRRRRCRPLSRSPSSSADVAPDRGRPGPVGASTGNGSMLPSGTAEHPGAALSGRTSRSVTIVGDDVAARMMSSDVAVSGQLGGIWPQFRLGVPTIGLAPIPPVLVELGRDPPTFRSAPPPGWSRPHRIVGPLDPAGRAPLDGACLQGATALTSGQQDRSMS